MALSVPSWATYVPVLCFSTYNREANTFVFVENDDANAPVGGSEATANGREVRACSGL